MSVEELKKQIVEKVNVLNDEKALKEILEIINNDRKNAPAMIDATKHADYLFSKHDGLLKRLS
jgi:hypothetical protein